MTKGADDDQVQATADSPARARKYKIAMVAACPFPANHGSPASIKEMSEALVELGHEVHIVTYPIKEDIPVIGPIIHRVYLPFFKKDKITVGPAIEKFFLDPLMVFKLIYVIYKYRIDVIHSHNYEAALIGWMAKVVTRRPMLYNAVNSMADELPSYDFFRSKKFALRLGKFLDRSVPRLANFITTVSDELKDFLVGQGVSPEKIQVMPAGVNTEMFTAAETVRIRERHNLGDDPIVLYTGSLDAFQRIDYLIEAMVKVVAARPNARLMLATSINNPRAIETCRAYSEKMGISDNVVIAQDVSLTDLPGYLNAGDVAVVPRPECPGHPVKLLNYMASRSAIVSFKGGAKGLHHMYNGYLADDHDVDQLAEGILYLLDEDEHSEILAEQARTTVENHFTWKILVQALEVIYDYLLTGKGDIDRQLLNRYICESYIPQYGDRRDESSGVDVDECVRTGDRRKNAQRINFIERRKIVFK